MQMRKILKVVLSTLLILLFLFLAFTGALLYFGKTGIVLGFARSALRGAHFAAAVSMFVLIPIHFFANFRLYKAELKAARGDARGKAKREKS